MDNQNRETGVNFFGLLTAPFKKWRVLVALLLVGAILGTGIAWKNSRSAAAAAAARAAGAFDTGSLNLNAIQLYYDYNTLYQTEIEYEESNLLLKMDSNSVYSGLVQYFVTAEEKNADTVAAVLSSVLKSDADMERLYHASGLTCSLSDFRALISIRFSNADFDNESINGGVLSFCVAMEDETALNRVMKVFVSIAEEKLEEMRDLFPEGFSATQTVYKTDYGYSDFVVNAIRNASETRIAIEKEIKAIKTTLTSEDIAYYNYHYLGQTPSAGGGGFSLLTVIAGAFVAFVLAYVWFVFLYLFDGKLHDIRAAEGNYGLHLISVLPSKRKETFLDNLVWKCINVNTIVNDTDYTAALLSSLDFKEAVLAGNANDAEIRALGEELASRDSRLSFGAFSVQNAASFKAAASKEIILLVHMDKDYKSVLERELSVYAKVGKEVLGFIAVR